MSEEIKNNSCQEASNDAKSNQTSESRQLELYSPNAAGLWSLVLTPVFGSWCVWQNYKTIGDEKAATGSKICTLLLFAFTVVLFVIPAFLPDRAVKAVRAFPILLLIIWYFAEQAPQVKYLKDKNIEYRKKSWGKPVFTAVIAIILLYFVLTGIIGAVLVSG